MAFEDRLLEFQSALDHVTEQTSGPWQRRLPRHVVTRVALLLPDEPITYAFGEWVADDRGDTGWAIWFTERLLVRVRFEHVSNPDRQWRTPDETIGTADVLVLPRTRIRSLGLAQHGRQNDSDDWGQVDEWSWPDSARVSVVVEGLDQVLVLGGRRDKGLNEFVKSVISDLSVT